MKVNGTQLAIAAAAALAVYVVVKRDAIGAAKAAGQAVNPVSQDNIFYSGASSVIDVLDDGSSNGSSSVGTWLYQILNPGQ